MSSPTRDDVATGALLILAFLLFMAHIVTGPMLGAWRATIVVVTAYGFPVGLAAVGLFLRLRSHDEMLALVAAFGFGAHGLTVVIVGSLLLAGLEFPDLFATFGGAAVPGTGVASALELSMDRIRAASFVFLGLGLLATGFVIVRNAVLSRAIGWWAIAGGVAGLVGFGGDLFGAFSVGALIPLLALTVFGSMMALGVRFMTLRPAAP